MNGKVTLVGAGCGEYDLMTLRALNALMECDTVVYDSLIDIRILEQCPKSAEKIPVGKRAGRHSAPQEEINALLVEKALMGRNVVRLKGGDPFVFGRGGEEITALKKSGVPFSVIPGISSCIAVPELGGIPVTHRQTARSFHVITAHTAEDMSVSFAKYARLDGTLVFLMGLGSLDRIAEGLISGGMSADMPAAVISNGATSRRKIVRAELGGISEAVRRAEISSPAVIIVGETAAFDFSATFKPPLEGVSAAVISAADTGEKLCAGLHKLGAYAYRVGGAEIRELSGSAADSAFSRLGEYGCIAFSSPNGARIFLKKMREKRLDIRQLCGVRLAVIGSGTAGVLEETGLFPEIMPESYNSAALGRLLAEKLAPSERLLILRSSEGSDELTAPLDEKGLQYDDVKIYKPVYLDGQPVSADYAVFTSAGTARGFFANGGSVSPNTKCAAIGEVTARELKKHGIADCLIPAESTAQGIADIIAEDRK